MKALLPALLAIATPSFAQDAAPACGQRAVMPGFEQWGTPTATTPTVGAVATLRLRPAAEVPFTPALNRPAAAGTRGGVFPLTVVRRGRYAVALSERGWIDLVAGGKRLESVAHTHGSACSGIAKIVTFDLAPGRVWIQLSDVKAVAIRVMVSDRPRG